MPSNSTSICIPCRWAAKHGECPGHHAEHKDMGTHWRAPKNSNIKAWERIAAGDIWWDKKARPKWYPGWFMVKGRRTKLMPRSYRETGK